MVNKVHNCKLDMKGPPNAVVHWMHKLPNRKVIFDITTEPAVPAG